MYHERYASIGERCCADRNVSAPLRLACGGARGARGARAGAGLRALAGRDVVFVGDSIAEQFFVAVACALWEDGVDVRARVAAHRQTLDNGVVLRSWAAAVPALRTNLSFVRYDRHDDAGRLRPDLADALGRADTAFTIPMHSMLPDDGNVTARTALAVRKFLSALDARLPARARRIVGANLPHHFPVDPRAPPGTCATRLADSSWWRGVGGPRSGAPDPSNALLDAAHRAGWRTLGAGARLVADRGDLHVGDVGAYRAGAADCVHFCALPGVLSAFGRLFAAAVGDLARARARTKEEPAMLKAKRPPPRAPSDAKPGSTARPPDPRSRGPTVRS